MMTTEHTLTLSPAMARAVAEGRKTQHRVMLEPQPPEWIDGPAGFSILTPPRCVEFRGHSPEGYGCKFIELSYWQGDTLLIKGTRCTITNVRVQRVQDISELDAIAEGCRPFFDESDPQVYVGPNGTEHTMLPLKGPIDDFARHWNATHGPDAWARNDWVVALTFRKETP